IAVSQASGCTNMDHVARILGGWVGSEVYSGHRLRPECPGLGELRRARVVTTPHHCVGGPERPTNFANKALLADHSPDMVTRMLVSTIRASRLIMLAGVRGVARMRWWNQRARARLPHRRGRG